MPKNELEQAVDLVEEHFSRCVNYPRDGKGLHGLASDLIHASNLIGIAIELIAERCAELGDRCPTRFEFISAAEAIRGPISEPQPKLDEVNRVPEETFREMAAGFDWKAIEAVHQKRSDEYRAVMREARKTSLERSRLPAWKLGASISVKEEAEIRERLGFELRRGDLEAMGRA